MNETSKMFRVWGDLEKNILSGDGIDIGCGPDPVKPNVRRFDIEDGDANDITKFVHEQFDFVYSSHCLEHMKNPYQALLGWWQLVKPGGHIFFLVPDEDLYEQGVFPSRFNADHKATFTLSKTRSWSPVSVNVLDLALSLPDAELVSLKLQDIGYDRSLMTHGLPKPATGLIRLLIRAHQILRGRLGLGIPTIQEWIDLSSVVDQTGKPDVLAQIQCIVRKGTRTS